ncbi:hypothetical protein DSO57_1028292 [Entomophthora muscae]|uniref:Uncharacterized protein n=1 Tax=Entomophthora muscae TaxID=34485 RepID=A0ACC2TNW1_9FUNG|nr:hypothetical protein DSO57_1028292 [Entomophthora muscae]
MFVLLCLLSEENPGQLLYLFKDLPVRAHDLLFTGESLVKSLTSDDVEIALPIFVPESYLVEENLVLIPIVMKEPLLPQDLPVLPEHAPGCTFWLLISMLLIKLNDHLSQLSSTLSL